jgi:hypothetical protein
MHQEMSNEVRKRSHGVQDSGVELNVCTPSLDCDAEPVGIIGSPSASIVEVLSFLLTSQAPRITFLCLDELGEAQKPQGLASTDSTVGAPALNCVETIENPNQSIVDVFSFLLTSQAPGFTFLQPDELKEAQDLASTDATKATRQEAPIADISSLESLVVVLDDVTDIEEVFFFHLIFLAF